MIDRENFATCQVLRNKTAGVQTLGVPELLRPYLRSWHEFNGKPTKGIVFPARSDTRGTAGQQRTSGTTFAKRLRRDLRRALVWAQIPVRDELFVETPATLPVDFHSFRRSFVTALANADVNAQTAMRLAGHTSASTHMRYVMQTSADVPEAALPKLRTPKKEKAGKGLDGAFSTPEPSKTGAPGRIRTSDLRLRRPLLFPD
jgi:integrase